MSAGRGHPDPATASDTRSVQAISHWQQLGRPVAGRGGRCLLVSGREEHNTMKPTVIVQYKGRTLWTDALRPGRMHDATGARNEGIAFYFAHFADVEVLLGDGYLGLRRGQPRQAITLPKRPNKIAVPFVLAR
ncbi:transposase family protein [Streptomyces sp. NPDC059489]|uniref:transposase family protein n=1 Tax=Streptomyces sp. NPDC059489 TaxID=3346849 RepID=UPI00368E3B0F